MNSRLAAHTACVTALTFVFLLLPFAEASAASATQIDDPVADTIQIWTAFTALFQTVTHELAIALEFHQPPASAGNRAQTASPALVTEQQSAGVPNNAPSTGQASEQPSIATTTVEYRYIPQPAITYLVQVSSSSDGYVTQSEFAAGLSALNGSLNQLIDKNSFEASASPPLGGGASNTIAAASAIDQLSGVTITNANLTASEIPSLDYLSLAGGTLVGDLLLNGNATTSGTSYFSGNVGIGTSSSQDALAVNGSTLIANVSAPPITTNRLYANGGSLYWAGSVIAGGATGNWTSDGTNVWRTGGNVGIGTTSPFVSLSVVGNGYLTGSLTAAAINAINATTTNATSSNLFSTLANFTTGFISTLSGTTLTYTAASTTNISASGEGYFGTASTTNLTVSGSPSGFLQTNAQGVVSATSTFGASSLFGTLSVANGGTGTSTAPSYGQLLVGNGSGGYSLLATSSLGISGGGDSGTVTSITAGTGLSGGTITTSGTIALNLASANNWTGLQQFSNASTTLLSAYGPAYFGGSATSSFNSAGQLTLANLSNSLLSVNSSGQVVATSTIGNGQLQNSSITVNGTGISLGSSGTITAASSTLLANNNTFSGANLFTGLTTLGNASTTLLSVSGNSYLGTGQANSFSISSLSNCSGDEALQTNGSGGFTCGTIATGGASSGGGWITDNAGHVTLSTTTYAVAIGASTTPYAKLSIIGSNVGSTTLALVPATSQTANIIDIYNNTGALSSVFTTAGNLGLGTTSPSQPLSVNGNTLINGSIAQTGGATSTFSGGLNIVSGCLSINGVCVGTGAGTSNVSTTSPNTWNALQIFAGNASSTNFSNFGTAYFGGSATSSFNSAGQLTLTGLSNSILSTNGSGQVVGTSSIGTNILSGSLATINGTPIFANTTNTITAASSTLLANSNTFSGADSFSNASSNFAGTWQALSPSHFQTAGTYLTGLGNYATTTGTAISLSTSSLSFNGLTLGETIAASANALNFTPTVTGTLNNSGLANSTIGATSPNATLALGSAASLGSTFTADLNLAHSNWWNAAQNFTNASTSQFTATSTVWFPSIINALLATDQNGKLVATSSIGNSLLTNSGTLNVSGGSGLSGGGAVSLGGSTSLSLNLANVNNWTGLQTFANATTSLGTISTLWLPNITAGALLKANTQGQVTAAVAGTDYIAPSNLPCTQASDIGMVGDGTTSNDTQFATWVSSLGTSGGCLQFGAGKYKFNSAHTINIPNSASGSDDTNAISTITLLGDGADQTTLYFPNSAGLTFNYSSQQHAIHLRAFSITTGTTNAGNAITLTNSYAFFGTFVAQSDIYDVTCRGDDGYALNDYWSGCVSVSNVSDINFDNDNFYGTDNGNVGIGIEINSPGAGCFTSPITCGTIYNISNSNFSFLGTAFIYGANTQTVEISNTDFLQDTTGISVPASGGTLQGLSVTNSTFFTIGQAIVTSTALPNLVLTGNFFDVPNGLYAIALTPNDDSSIVGNQFIPRAPSSPTPAGGIYIATSTGVSTIDGNTFSTVGVNGAAIFLATSSSGVTVGSSNVFTGNTTNISNSGTGNLIFSSSGTNFGIGTTNPGNALEVDGTGGSGFLRLRNSAASSGLYWQIGPDSSNNLVAYNQNSAGSFITANGSGNWQTNSDQRLKKNIQPLEASSSLEEILSLNPVSFNWLSTTAATTTQLGFIAQQVQQIFPELVSQGPDVTISNPDGSTTTIPKAFGLDYTGLISPLVSAVQSIANITSTFQENLIAWLGNASNGIVDFFAENGHFSNELCVGSTCVTPAQFQSMVAAANASQIGGTPPAGGTTTTPDTAPVIQINGDNPAFVQVGATYDDLGATITGPTADLNLDIQTFVNGYPMNPVQIDTRAVATDTIDYVVTDQNGITSTSTRTVIINAVSTDSEATTTAS